MAKDYIQSYYYQPIQNVSGVKPSKRGKTLLAVGGFLVMVGIAYFIYKKIKKDSQIKGSIKSTVPNLPVWNELKVFDPTTSKVSIKGSGGNYYTSAGVGAYVGEATGNTEKGSDGLVYREVVPPSDRKDMFKNSAGGLLTKAYVLAKVTEGYK
jgi:hypothetical protein